MPKLVIDANETVTGASRGGVCAIVAMGTMGGGTIAVQYQTAEMVADSDWADVTVGDADAPAVLSIATANRSVAAYIPAGAIRATMSGATSPSVRLYVETSSK